ncbi:MAG: alanine racemase [Candidatus Metalachnospira sp.]|nr:alanine racemase [Candidatus Metalachnospira sp.]
MDFVRRTWVEISIENLKYNYYQTKGLLKKDVKIMAVLKANAYNCGDVRIASELENIDKEIQFAVSNIEEAMGLRNGGIKAPILVLGYTPLECIKLLLEYDITQTLVSYEYALEIKKTLKNYGHKLKVNIKLDTGMGRIGIVCYNNFYEDSINKVKEICSCSEFNVTGCYTHISTLYENDEDSLNYSKLQFERFMKATDLLFSQGVKLGNLHCLNSAGTANMSNDMQLDMVRVGTLIYGALPDVYNHSGVKFKPIVTIKCRVAKVDIAEEGCFIGYSRAFRAERKTKTAVLTMGYSDILRMGSGKGYVLINDTLCPVIGGVCMDQMVADISNAGEVRAGDTAVVIGRDKNNEIGFNKAAEFLQCGEEEVYCHITSRPTKVYI